MAALALKLEIAILQRERDGQRAESVMLGDLRLNIPNQFTKQSPRGPIGELLRKGIQTNIHHPIAPSVAPDVAGSMAVSEPFRRAASWERAAGPFGVSTLVHSQ
ncbi:hypothetical protein [Bradyrhizobium sp. RD5-C2]|uniref:hypothetical protein n=1 Tax=Bradyrhizobium sp. RD5-C2 TaxID=244562 RepID=UPI001CC66C93|nr:hypothetical protein [Bradyrhizobium sp. RD5-C2]GIQ74905.1 hypothetical protein BraRD5C2_33460 [Bradyrhizobium sp. RD5-C2]